MVDCDRAVVSSAALVALLGVIGRHLLGTTAGVVAALLLATSPVHLRYATILVPEPMLEVLMLAGIWVYVRYLTHAAVKWSVVSGALLAMAYLAKESAAFVVPAVLIHAASRREWRRAASVMAGVLLIVAMEHAYDIAATGDPLFRLHALAGHNRSIARVVADTGEEEAPPVVPAVSDTNAASATSPPPSPPSPPPSPVPAVTAESRVTDTAAPALTGTGTASGDPASPPRPPLEHTHELPPSTVHSHFNLGYRLLKSYPRLMILPNDHLGLHSIFALLFAGGGFLLWLRDRRAQFLFFWAALPWLYLNLGTTSLTQVPADSRKCALHQPDLSTTLPAGRLDGGRSVERRENARPAMGDCHPSGRCAGRRSAGRARHARLGLSHQPGCGPARDDAEAPRTVRLLRRPPAGADPLGAGTRGPERGRDRRLQPERTARDPACRSRGASGDRPVELRRRADKPDGGNISGRLCPRCRRGQFPVISSQFKGALSFANRPFAL